MPAVPLPEVHFSEEKKNVYTTIFMYAGPQLVISPSIFLDR